MTSPLFRAASMGLLLAARLQAFGTEGMGLSQAEPRPVQSVPPKPMKEYEAKARCVSLLLLPEYIKWPAAGQEGGLRVLGVIGECLFKKDLNELFAPGKPASRKARLVYLTNFRTLESCDALFICESESERLYEILRRIKGRPILTLGDTPDFAQRGVMINLALERDRIGLEVNLPVLRLSGLELNSNVLKNAKIIE